MREITNASWIKAKGLLFLILGLLSAAILFFAQPNLKTGFLIIAAVWSFCRFYYLAFYVIERYVDPHYRFSGLATFVLYLIREKRSDNRPDDNRGDKTS